MQPVCKNQQVANLKTSGASNRFCTGITHLSLLVLFFFFLFLLKLFGRSGLVLVGQRKSTFKSHQLVSLNTDRQTLKKKGGFSPVTSDCRLLYYYSYYY